MKIRRIVTWPFAVFLMTYGLPSNDPTVVTVADVVLSSLVIGVVWGVLLGLPLAAVFRKGDQPLTRGTFLAMGLAFAVTFVLDLQGWGLLGATGYIFWLRAAGARARAPEPAPGVAAD